jgi:hypothetical protein
MEVKAWRLKDSTMHHYYLIDVCIRMLDASTFPSGVTDLTLCVQASVVAFIPHRANGERAEIVEDSQGEAFQRQSV